MKKHSYSLKKKRLEKKIKKILFFYLFPSLFIFSFFLLLFNSEYLAIKNINLNLINNEKNFITQNEIKDKINFILNQKYKNIFSKRNYLFYPESEIKDILKKEFFVIKDINLTRGKIFKDLNIDIVLEKDKFIFCKSLKKEKCFYLSERGKIFKEYKFRGDNDRLVFISSDKKNGENIFDSERDLEKILKFAKFLDNKYHLKIKYFVKKNKYLYILILNDNTKILLNSDFNLIEKENTFSKISGNGDLKIIDGGFLKNISYINLSLKNKIFYCLKSEECEGNY